MDNRGRADRLIATLRWLVVLVALIELSDTLSPLCLTTVVVGMATCTAIISWSVADTRRYIRFGRRLSALSYIFDIAIITILTATAPSHRSGIHIYIMYWFVLVSSGFTNTSVRDLGYTTLLVIAANGFATIYAIAPSHSFFAAIETLTTRSATLGIGFLVAAYIARSRHQDELVSDRGTHLHAILDFGARLTSFRGVHELSAYIVRTAAGEINAEGAALFLINEDSQRLEYEAVYTQDVECADKPQVEEEPVQVEVSCTSCAEWVLNSGREFMLHTSREVTPGDSFPLPNRFVIAMPLLWQSSSSGNVCSVLGALVVWSLPGEEFSDDEIYITRIFSSMSAAAIVNLRLYTNLQKSFLCTLQSLAKGLEARDEYTRGHSERVMKVACLIAERLGIDPDSIELLRNASLLHDIGKIGVPDAVLRKTSKLTMEEWEAMRRHPTVGEEICKPLGLPPEVLFLIKHHHEHLDGKGYPSGLTPAEQPLLQRILVVSDSFDAMRSRRPYRDTMSEADLRIELSRASGRTMDPTVVDTILSLMETDELKAIYEHDRLTNPLIQTAHSTRRKAA